MMRPAPLAAALTAFLGFQALPIAAPSVSAAADCGLVRDHDTRRACFAERDRRPSDCGLIRDGDARRMCRLRAGRR